MSLDELLDRQRANVWAEAEAARERDAEVVRAHPSGHLGRCPASSGGTITRGEVEAHGSGAIWHLDVDQAPPSWWPKTGMVIAPPTPAELSAQRARRSIELEAAEASDRVRSRNVR